MPRPREFDPEHAKQTALDAFWTHGYVGTSLDELTRRMGISRSSFYAAFGSKHRLYLECVELYTEVVMAQLRAGLGAGESAESLIRDTVDKVLAATGSAGSDRRGCFLGNTAVEVAPGDAEAAARTREGLDRLSALFEELLEAGVAAGELTPGGGSAAAARFLVAAVQGAIVLGKAGASPEIVRGAASRAVDAVV